MKAYIASFNFSPGHLSHLIAWYKLFNLCGYNTKLLLHNDYNYIIEDNLEVYYINAEKNIDASDTGILFIYSPAIKNNKYANIFKESGAKIIYLYHEPWHSLREYLKEGVVHAFKASGAHFFSTKLLKIANVVIVPSQFALHLYERKDIKYNNNVFVIPLLFDDEANEFEINSEKKKYFSYIGTACKGHAFDRFIDFILSFDKSEILKLPFRFQIATRTDISKYINKDVDLLIKQGILKLKQGKPLVNSEINQAYTESFAVWNLYNRSTQSGVLPKTFMFGACPIASNIGSFPEFINNGENGFLIDEYDFENLKKIVYKSFEEKDKMIVNCRNSFFNYFYFANYKMELKQIIEKIRSI